jgi:serine/threonine protein kinase
MKVPEQEILHKIKIEAAVMMMCANKNIINYNSSYYYMNCLFMLIEYMDGGALTDIIYQNLKKIPEKICAYIMKEILQGLKALHEHKQIHRDLKSDNILVAKDGTIKVADFGFAIQLTKEQKNRKSVVGTPAWMAPELIKKEPYNELVDVWSVGVIAVELAEGEPPFLRMPPLKAMYFISTKDPHRLNKMKFSPAYCDFVEKCL